MKIDTSFFKGGAAKGLTTALTAVVLVFIMSAGLRYIQLERWREHKEYYFVDKMPQMTTLDSYKWLRYADEYKKGEYYPSDNDPLMFYPDERSKHKTIPMISWLIAKLSVFSDGNIYRTAVYLLPFLASLFVIPLGLYFYFTGMIPAGIAGGIAGSIGIVYLVRTAIGRVDTDAMNLFFPFLTSLFMLLASEAKDSKRLYIHSVLAGLSMWLFYWWYEHPGITVAYLGVFVLVLLLSKAGIKKTAVSVALFALFANPIQLFYGFHHIFDFFAVYITPSGSIAAGFPDVYATITEARRTEISRVLVSLTPFKALSVSGLVLFAVCGLFNFRRMLPLAPVFVLGLMVFKSSNRFGMFLTPFVGIGLGYGIYLLFKAFEDRVKLREQIKYAVSTAVAAAFMLIVYNSSFDFNPSPSIEVGIYKQIRELKKAAPQDAVIYSWWDYGLAYEYAGFTTFHDGMTQRTPKTYYVAKSLSSSSQEELYNTIAFLATEGRTGIDRILSEDKTPQDISAMAAENEIPVQGGRYVVLFTRDMLYKMGAISQLGTWDFETGKSVPFTIINMRCTQKEGDVVICGKDRINLATGIVNSSLPLLSHTVTVNGKLFNSREFPYANGVHLIESRWESGSTDFMILDEKAFRSNMVQMFVIGNADSSRFTEIFNSVPFMRAFVVNGR
ncbi:undecaprenyl-diphosphooligosaccharide--protein glycotransferase [Geovibrio sp. ADMFC3]